MKISIITPVYNDPRIEHCLESVRGQCGEFKLEHVVVNGGSTDETVEILNTFDDHIDRRIQEPDDGIYDAMNKGIEAMTGDVVGILNADDQYHDDRVLQRVTDRMADGNADACYGDIVYTNSDETVVRYWKSGSFAPKKFYLGWMPPHPTFFVRKEMYETYGVYDLDFLIAADYEFMLRTLLKEDISVEYIDEVLVNMAIGGESNGSLSNIGIALLEVYRAWEKHDLMGRYAGPVFHPLTKLPQYRVKSLLFG